MSETFNQHSKEWVNFSYFSFAFTLVMIFGGIFFLQLDWWIKGFFAMGVVALVQATISLTKTLRDNVEAEKLLRKVEDAKTERLLLEMNKGDADAVAG